MANHGFASFKKNIDPDRVSEVFHRVNREKFRGMFTLEHELMDGGSHSHFWGISFEDTHIQIWLSRTFRKLEVRHGGGDLRWFVEGWFFNSVAKEFGGMISDEGTGDEHWEPDFCEKYPTFRAYINSHARHMPKVIGKSYMFLAKRSMRKDFRYLW